MNRDSVPILKLNVEFNFRNAIAEVRPNSCFRVEDKCRLKVSKCISTEKTD
jgi:hypothetical protein